MASPTLPAKTSFCIPTEEDRTALIQVALIPPLRVGKRGYGLRNLVFLQDHQSRQRLLPAAGVLKEERTECNKRDKKEFHNWKNVWRSTDCPPVPEILHQGWIVHRKSAYPTRYFTEFYVRLHHSFTDKFC